MSCACVAHVLEIYVCNKYEGAVLHVADAVKDNAIVIRVLVEGLAHFAIGDHALCLGVNERMRRLV